MVSCWALDKGLLRWSVTETGACWGNQLLRQRPVEVDSCWAHDKGLLGWLVVECLTKAWCRKRWVYLSNSDSFRSWTPQRLAGMSPDADDHTGSASGPCWEVKSLTCSMSFSSHWQRPHVSQLSLAQFKPECFTWLCDVWSVLTCVYVDDVRVQNSPASCYGLSCDLLKMARFSFLLRLAQSGYKMIGVFTFHLTCLHIIFNVYWKLDGRTLIHSTTCIWNAMPTIWFCVQGEKKIT